MSGINFGQGNEIEVTGNVVGNIGGNFKVQVDENEIVTVYKNRDLVGTCESYELDAICKYLEVEYEEV
jgi:hypothetical protein